MSLYLSSCYPQCTLAEQISELETAVIDAVSRFRSEVGPGNELEVSSC